MEPTTSVRSCLDLASEEGKRYKMSLHRFWMVAVLTVTLCQVSEGALSAENVTMAVGDRLILKSKSFPECCVTQSVYHLRCTRDCGFDIVFIDMDLPQSASVTFHDGPSTESPVILSAQVEQGAWKRPSLVHKSNVLTIATKVHTPKVYPYHTGFKIAVDTFNTVLTQRSPALTSASTCGSVRSLVEWSGGEVNLTPISNLPNPVPDADCVWVLHKPARAKGEVFIRFTYTDDLHGILDIRNGSYSEAPEVFYVDSDKGSKVVLHGREGFTSTNPLFFRMKKPSDRGSLTFVYGLFERQQKPDNDLYMCWLANGTSEGFYCEKSEWCIPFRDKCDGVRQCPRGEDEVGCPITVAPPSTTTTPVPIENSKVKTTETYCPFNRLCPDGSCAYKCPGECFAKERLCEDGSCVWDSAYSRCPGECARYQKKCPDGRCIMRTERCPGDCFGSEKKCSNGACIESRRYCDEEACPKNQRYRCGNKCYGEQEVCNESEWCDSGQDELDCNVRGQFPWYVIVIVALVIVVVASFACSKVKNNQARRRSQEREGNAVTSPINSNAHTRWAPAPATAGAAPASRRPNTVNVYPTYNATDAATRDTSAPTAPLAPSAPPSYSEAIESRPVPTAPASAATGAGPLPPPYEDVASANPPKVAL